MTTWRPAFPYNPPPHASGLSVNYPMQPPETPIPKSPLPPSPITPVTRGLGIMTDPIPESSANILLATPPLDFNQELASESPTMAFDMGARQGETTPSTEYSPTFSFRELDMGDPDLSELDGLLRQANEHYRWSQHADHLDKAVLTYREALALCQEGHSERPECLRKLGWCLRDRFLQSNSTDDLQEAIRLSQEGAKLQDPGTFSHILTLENLAGCLKLRFEHEGNPDDMVEVIQVFREVLQLRPPGDPDRNITLCDLSSSLSKRFEDTHNINDLTEAINLTQEEVDLLPFSHPDRFSTLSRLAKHLKRRYTETKDDDDLARSIRFLQEAVDLCPLDDPNLSLYLTILSHSFATQFKQLNALEDLTKAIDLGNEALALRPAGHPNRHRTLHLLATCLDWRFYQTWDGDTLTESITFFEEILALHPPGHPERHKYLAALAGSLRSRWERLGSSDDDLAESIRLSQEAFFLCPPNHPDYSSLLYGLSHTIGERSKQSGNRDDLEEAIRLAQESLKLRPPGDPDRSETLTKLATWLTLRFDEAGRKDDLARAIHLHREASALPPPKNRREGRADTMTNLASSLYRQFELTGDMNDCAEAIRLNREALELCPRTTAGEHSLRAYILSSLADGLLSIFEEAYDDSGLIEAIGLLQEVLELYPSSHPGRSSALTQLAVGLSLQIDEMRDASEDTSTEPLPTGMGRRAAAIDRLIQALRDATLPSPSSIHDRLSAAKKWRSYALKYGHESWSEATNQTLDLLDQSVAQSRSLENLYQHLSEDDLVREAQKVASRSAALAFERGDIPLGVTFLERGRSIIFTQLGRFRQGFDEVKGTIPDLARRFSELSAVLNDLVLHGKNAKTLQASKRGTFEDLGVVYHETHAEWVKTVNEIRKCDGLETFLRPPSFQQLQTAAKGGPIILLSVDWKRSDAIVVPAVGDPILVPLPEVTPRVVNQLADQVGERPAERHADDVVFILREVWRVIVAPIVAQLLAAPVELRRGSRIWWCPTGAASRLPLHAAGPYARGQRNFSNYFVSSYTPTLGALIRARQRRTDEPALRTPARSLLIVGQPETPGERPLPKVEEEVRAVKNHAPHALVLQSSQGTQAAVLSGLEEHRWLHLACHGHHQPTQPFKSHFSMHDAPITLLDIIKKDLPHAELAVLSACHSARISTILPDEVLHPAAGMLFAGYKSVVGTMWALDDGVGSALANKFYELMLGGKSGPRKHTDAAVVLAKALNALDREGHQIPFMQRINIIHYGA